MILNTIIGESKEIISVKRLIEKFKDLPFPIQLLGESGTGKDLVAKHLHYTSEQKNKPFIVQNCAAIPESLFESELFGSTRGAFTGAVIDKPGYLELANGGTMFLDEISEMSMAMQAKILRVIEDRMFYRVGLKKIEVNVRFVFATNKDLVELVRNGKFREDLFYRVNVIGIKLPSLRERKEDIPLLAEHFVKQTEDMIKKTISLGPAGLKKLITYDWPGNVRELDNIIKRAASICDGNVLNENHIIFEAPQMIKEPETFDEIKKQSIIKALQICYWNQARAAKRLNIPRTTLQSMMKKYGIEKE